MSEKGQEDTYRPAGSTARQPLTLGGAATEDPAEPSPSCSVQGLVRSIIGSRAPPLPKPSASATVPISMDIHKHDHLSPSTADDLLCGLSTA